jgi:hypothetical protein
MSSPFASMEAAKEATVLLYASGANLCFEEPVKNADRVFYLDGEPGTEVKVAAKSNLETRPF